MRKVPTGVRPSSPASMPSSSKSSRRAACRGSSPAVICPADEVSRPPGNESFSMLRFCSRTCHLPCSLRITQMWDVRCRIPLSCAMLRATVSPVGSPFSSTMSKISSMRSFFLSRFHVFYTKQGADAQSSRRLKTPVPEPIIDVRRCFILTTYHSRVQTAAERGSL